MVTPGLAAVGKEISPGVWSGEIGMILNEVSPKGGSDILESKHDCVCTNNHFQK